MGHAQSRLSRARNVGTGPAVSTGEVQVPFGQLRPSERRALIGCAFAAGCIELMPGELVGAGIAFVLAIGLGVWHSRRSKKERNVQGAAA